MFYTTWLGLIVGIGNSVTRSGDFLDFGQLLKAFGLVVMGDDSCLKGCGFESRRNILNGHLDIFSH